MKFPGVELVCKCGSVGSEKQRVSFKKKNNTLVVLYSNGLEKGLVPLSCVKRDCRKNQKPDHKNTMEEQ